MAKLRLGYYYHIPVKVIDGKKMTPGYQGRFIESLAKECEKLVCFLHSSQGDKGTHFDHAITSPNLEWVDLGVKRMSPLRTFIPGPDTEKLEPFRGKIDALLTRCPTPLLPGLCGKARDLGIPPVLLVVGNYVDGIADLHTGFIRSKVTGIYLRIFDLMQRREIKNCHTYVNSAKLFNLYKDISPDIKETKTTTLDLEDFFEREDTCQRSEIHLLYVGRYDFAKGLKFIVGAMKALRDKGYNCRFDLAGWDPSNSGVIAELTDYARTLGVVNYIKEHGFKAMGDDLWSIYRNADIFINASMASEGFPRTIWEAMANSVPVVATDVGSIKSFVGEATEIVAPRDQRALTQGVEKIIKDEALRKDKIRKGFALTKKNTLTARAREIIGGIESIVAIKNHVESGELDSGIWK